MPADPSTYCPVCGLAWQAKGCTPERCAAPNEADIEPRCGVDFCDNCGDCLHCYGADDGANECSDGHNWATFEEKVAAIRAAKTPG